MEKQQTKQKTNPKTKHRVPPHVKHTRSEAPEWLSNRLLAWGAYLPPQGPSELLQLQGRWHGPLSGIIYFQWGLCYSPGPVQPGQAKHLGGYGGRQPPRVWSRNALYSH